MIDQATLRKLLDYDPATGVFVWRVRQSYRINVFDVAGYIGVQGHRRIGVLGHLYWAHRLAWLYMTGAWPSEIDHINGDRADNRWSNLRSVTRLINNQNLRRARWDSGTGIMGVGRRRSGKFQAQIRLNGRRLHLGYFSTADAAHAAYLKAKRELHPGCTI